MKSEVIFPHDTVCLEEFVKNLRLNNRCRVDVSLFFAILFCKLKIMFWVMWRGILFTVHFILSNVWIFVLNL